MTFSLFVFSSFGLCAVEVLSWLSSIFSHRLCSVSVEALPSPYHVSSSLPTTSLSPVASLQEDSATKPSFETTSDPTIVPPDSCLAPSPVVSAVAFTEFSCPYLSPLVLRKEVESAVSSFRSDLSLLQRFRQKHATIFWNLLWYFKHLNLPLDILVGFENALKVSIRPILSSSTDEESSQSQHRFPTESSEQFESKDGFKADAKKLAEIVECLKVCAVFFSSHNISMQVRVLPESVRGEKKYQNELSCALLEVR